MNAVREIQEAESTTGKLKNNMKRNSKLRKSNLKLIFKPFSEYVQLSPFKGKKSKCCGNLPLTLGNLYREELNFNKPKMVEEPDSVSECNFAKSIKIKHIPASDMSYADEKFNAQKHTSCESKEKSYDENLLKIKAVNRNHNNKEPFNAKLSIFKTRSNDNTASDKSDAEWYHFLTKLDEILDNRVGEFV